LAGIDDPGYNQTAISNRRSLMIVLRAGLHNIRP
jgi:hypothetical protein